MFALLLCFVTQPNNELFTRLDSLFDKQVTQLQTDIDAAKRDPQRVMKLKQELAALTKNYNLTIPMFDFGKGVQTGDIGNLGYSMEESNRVVGYSANGTPVRAGYERMERPGKVGPATADGGRIIYLPPFGRGEQVAVYGLPKEYAIDEKVISLNKFIMEYLGKESALKRYKIIGNEADYLAWKKYRSTKK